LAILRSDLIENPLIGLCERLGSTGSKQQISCISTNRLRKIAAVLREVAAKTVRKIAARGREGFTDVRRWRDPRLITAPDPAPVRTDNPGMRAELADEVHQPLADERQDDHADRDVCCPKDGEEHVTSPQCE
jgi:hypothetical protein